MRVDIRLTQLSPQLVVFESGDGFALAGVQPLELLPLLLELQSIEHAPIRRLGEGQNGRLAVAQDVEVDALGLIVHARILALRGPIRVPNLIVTLGHISPSAMLERSSSSSSVLS
jgi:hypothetical protein